MPKAAKAEESRDLAQAIREDSRRRMFTTGSGFLSKLAAVVAAIGLLDFISFLVGASYLGGDAVNGKIDGGRYYLYGPYHGGKAFHEVSQAVFDYSRWHAYSLMITWPLMIVLCFAAERAVRRVH
ncbi:hypothetical protein HDF16_005581 [Granulicella aggregans]|uniref:Uncharacterized protein n=1 Tax=Granulicella aggregans TaxID=474949 RepID=A0A7W8E827_9BACT|nr:hypothetical protein [Granulicella aggregans]MBB5060845.1 hypothetical protein [Granulicella aggregans]